jgi:NADPH:quinone reductase-like Zn-dependent oxidoreductase
VGWKKFSSWFAGPRYHAVYVHPDAQALATIARLVDAGQLRPVVDRTFSLWTELPQAHDHVAAGHSKGKVVCLHTHPEDAS